MKKVFSIILAVTLILSCFVMPAHAYSFADDNGIVVTGETTADGFVYSIIDNGITTIDITGYTGTDTDIIIPTTIDGYTVNSIEDSAFHNCTALTSVIIPEGVQTIKSGAFSGCSSLKSIVIPDRVSSIGQGAFYGCSSLESIVISDKVTIIDEYTFYGCSSLKSVTIPNSVTKIQYQAFSGCSSLESITIPDSVTHIYSEAFYDCDNLKNTYYTGTIDQWVSIYMQNKWANPLYYSDCFYIDDELVTDVVISNTSIGFASFYGYSPLKSVTFAEGVTTIDMNAFACCSSLQSVTISDSVTSIGYNAFGDCSSLQSITIPKSVTKIDNSVFTNHSINFVIYGYTGSTAQTYANDNHITFVALDEEPEDDYTIEITYNMDNTATVSGYTGTPKEVVIPSKIGDYTVTGIDSYAFYDCTSLKSIVIPDSVTSIGEFAFGYCNLLESITIPDGVISIGNNTFCGCELLKNVTIPDSVTSIGSGAFQHCDSLEKTYYEGTVDQWVSINFNDIFSNPLYYSNCLHIDGELVTDAVITTATAINEYAFCGCSTLISVTIPDSVTSIGKYAFYGCDSIQNVTIPNSVDSIKVGTFRECKSLTSIVIPDSVTSIESEAFSGCKSLQTVTIPDSVINIGDNVFTFCPETLVIYGYEGSTAQTYANENDIAFVALVKEPEDEVIIGDIDGDGVVSIMDATSIQFHLAKIVEFDENQFIVADTDKNGEINITDATRIQLFLARIITEF